MDHKTSERLGSSRLQLMDTFVSRCYNKINNKTAHEHFTAMRYNNYCLYKAKCNRCWT